MDDEQLEIEQLNAELRHLFAPQDALVVDPDGLAATELLGSITVPIVEDALSTQVSAGADPSVAAPVLDLADLQQRGDERLVGRGLLVAAAVTAVALLGIGAWATRVGNGSSVASDEGGSSEVAGDGVRGSSLAIQGPDLPLVVFLPSELDMAQDDLVTCLSSLMTFGRPPNESWGLPAFVDTTIFEAKDGFDQVVISSMFEGDVSCQRGSGGSFGTSAPPTEVDPVIVSGWQSGGGELSFEGRLLDAVADVAIIEPEVGDQTFRRSDGLFRIDANDANIDPSTGLDYWEAEIRFSDGTRSRVTSEDSHGLGGDMPRCVTNTDCVSEQVTAIADDALAGGAQFQHEALVDGVLSQAEYDTALERFRACLRSSDSVQLDKSAAFLVERDSGFAEASACATAEIVFIEEARSRQNSHARFVDLFPVDHGEEVEMEEVFESTTIAKPIDASEEPRVVLSPILDVRARLTTQSDVEMFTVESPQKAYWRLATLDVFDGQIWRTRGSFEDVIGPLETTLPDGIRAAEVTQTFVIGGLGGIWLPTVGEPAEVLSTSGGLEYEPQSGTLIVDRETDHVDGLSYTLLSLVPERDLAAITAARNSVPDEIAERYLALPNDFSERVQAQAQIVVASAQAISPYEKALALQNYFRDTELFSYNVNESKDHPTSKIEEFLFDTHMGYSEQFASSYAVMARSVGLPARVAVGFTPGEFDPSIEAYRVNGSNAHAWPEVWMDGVGWLRFEPTPGRGAPRDEAYTGQAEAQAVRATD